MKENYTHIELVIDRSGSMGTMALEAQNSINEFVKDQRAVEGEATLSLTEFDNKFDTLYDFANLDDVKDYVLFPRGGTALMDAVGQRINVAGSKLASMSESDRPEKVVFVIVTDGGENASQEFKTEQIKEMIEKQQSQFDWAFVFLAANQDAFSVARSYGISTHNAMNFAATGEGFTKGVNVVASGIACYRTSSTMTSDSILSNE